MDERSALTPYHSALPEQPVIETQVIVTQEAPPQPRHRRRPPLEEIIRQWLDDKVSKQTRIAYERTFTDFVDYLTQYASERRIPVPTLWPSLFDLDSEEWPLLLDAAREFLPLRKNEERTKEGHSVFYLSDNPVTIATINQRVAILRGFYVFCQRKRWFPENPLIELKTLKGDDSPNAAYPLDAHQVKQAMQSIDTSTLAGKRDKAMLAILLQTARRASEVRLLTWEDIRTQEGRIVITFHCKGEKIKKDTLNTATQHLFEAYRSAYLYELQRRCLVFSNTMPVFIGIGNRSFGQALSHQAVSTLCLKYLGDSRVHVTRHTSAVSLKKLKVDKRDIKEQLGHSSEVITEIYLEQKSADVKPWLDDQARMFGIADEE